MNAMEKMLASMLSNMVPPEVLAALSPEKITEYTDAIKALIQRFDDRLTDIESNQFAILERLENVNNKYNSSKRGSGNKFIGDGTGDN